MPEGATPIGSVGRIVRAREEGEVGRAIEVRDDREGSTAGLYVLTWSRQERFDSWVESVDDLDRYFEDAGYVVDWSPDDIPH